MFTFNTTGSLVFGADALARLGEISRARGLSKVMLVTDAGMVKLGIAGRATKVLNNAGIAVCTYADVEADPTEAVVLSATDLAKRERVGGVIGIGGGSSMDVAKLVGLLATGTQALVDAYGVGKVTGRRLPLILVPTTAGTGSEVTPISIITTSTSEKMGVVSPVILPDVALLDPSLTISLPPHVTAATGIDAMVHAIEAYTSASPNNNPVSRGLAVQALRLMGPALLKAVTQGDDIEARSDMLLGAMLAGQAFANSPVAAVHALAYPLGGHYHVPHGLSNALVLPHVLRFNAASAHAAYAELAPHLFPELSKLEGQERASVLADSLSKLAADCGLPTRLRDVKVTRESIPILADDAMKQTRLLVNNPRQLTRQDAIDIYTAAF